MEWRHTRVECLYQAVFSELFFDIVWFFSILTPHTRKIPPKPIWLATHLVLISARFSGEQSAISRRF